MLLGLLALEISFLFGRISIYKKDSTVVGWRLGIACIAVGDASRLVDWLAAELGSVLGERFVVEILVYFEFVLRVRVG